VGTSGPGHANSRNACGLAVPPGKLVAARWAHAATAGAQRAAAYQGAHGMGITTRGCAGAGVKTAVRAAASGLAGHFKRGPNPPVLRPRLGANRPPKSRLAADILGPR
jgi:hypothetical protein